MIKIEEIEKKEFKKYQDYSLMVTSKEYIATFQKGFDDDIGTKYYITFEQREDKIKCFAKFSKNKNVFFVELVLINQAMEDIILFFENTWKTLKCDYDNFKNQ